MKPSNQFSLRLPEGSGLTSVYREFPKPNVPQAASKLNFHFTFSGNPVDRSSFFSCVSVFCVSAGGVGVVSWVRTYVDVISISAAPITPVTRRNISCLLLSRFGLLRSLIFFRAAIPHGRPTLDGGCRPSG